MGVAPRVQKKHMLTVSEKHDLDDVFYGSGLLIKQFPLFKEKTKNLNLSDDKLKYYYDNQEVVQLFRPIVVPKTYVSITASRPFSRLYLDSMYITPLNISLVCGVDLFSKYGFVKLYRGSSVDSTKASRALEEFVKEIVDMGFYPATIRTDPGSEFHGSFKSTCESLGIPLIYLEAGDKLQSSPIEAFNKTVRLGLEKVRSTLPSGQPVVSQLEKAIRDIVSSYNSTPHSSTKNSPSDILKSEDLQLELSAKNAIKKAQQLDSRGKALPVGTHVRLFVAPTQFNKLTPNWSKEMYKIERYDVGKNRYYVEGKKKGYQQYQLQVVNPNTLMKKTISRYIVEGGEKDVSLPSRSTRKALKELTTDLVGQGVEGSRERRKREVMDL